MKALGAYIFAGGFTLGMENHFDIQAIFEDGPYGVSTFRKNRPEIPVFDDPDDWPFDDDLYKGLELIYGNPPCAAWSPLGRIIQAGQDAWKTDPRIDCARTEFNLLEILRPKMWVWESVPGAFTRGRPLVDELTARAFKLGYSIDIVLHNAMYLGAYQHRKRFFMVATRYDIDWVYDPITPVPARDALELLERMPKRERRKASDEEVYRTNMPVSFISKVKHGQSLRAARAAMVEKRGEEAMAKVPRTGYALRRQHPDKPFSAVTGHVTIHPYENRFLSVEEMLFISGFPLDYQLDGPLSGQASLIARGVVPPVADWLGANFARAAKAKKVLIGERRRLIDCTTPSLHIGELPLREETN